MARRRLLPLLTVTALTLAACGGSETSDPDGGGSTDDAADPASEAATGSDETDAEDVGNSGDSGDSGETVDESGLAAAPLTPLWSAPAGGTALGATVAISPDGSEVALMTGGIEPLLQIHDGTTGELLRSAGYHGQGVELVWTTGAAQFIGSKGFRPLDATADGSRLVVLLSDTIEVYDLN